MIGGRVLDSSALVDAATGKSIYVRALVQTAVQHGIVLAVPTAALTTAWAAVTDRERPRLEVLLDTPVTVIDVLDRAAARDTGLLLAKAASGPAAQTQVAAGQVALSARRRNWPVVSTDPQPVRAIDPDLDFESLP
jgi:hypothetical protein